MAESSEATQPETRRHFMVIKGGDVTGFKHPTGYFGTLMHGVKGYLGTGVFAMGASMKDTGTLLGPLLLVVMAAVNVVCQHILIRTSVLVAETEDTVEVLPTFSETIHYTFEDSKGKFFNKTAHFFGMLCDVFLVMAEYGFCIVYYMFIANHIAEVCRDNGWDVQYRLMLVILLIPMWLLIFATNLRLLAWLSFVGNIFTYITCIILVYFIIIADKPFFSERPLITHEPIRIAYALGIILFAFEGITFIIPLRSEMKNPAHFTHSFGVLNVSVVTACAMYICLGLLCFWAWGQEAKGSAFLNLPENNSLADATRVMASLSVYVTFAFHSYIPVEIAYPRVYKKCGPFKYPRLTLFCYRTGAIIMIYLLANISDDLGAFISLVGCVTGSVLALLFPAMLVLALDYGHLTWYQIVEVVIIVLVGIYGLFMGSYLSISDIVEDFRKEAARNTTL